MQQSGLTTTPSWLSAISARPDARSRLFCFSYAGAGASAYRGWAALAPTTLEVCPIQLPGRENRLREPAVSSLPDLIAQLTDAILSWTDKPFAFFGHSFGALMAFETTRELRRRGSPLPTNLFVSACRAPQLPWPHPPVRHLDNGQLLVEVNRRYGSVPEVILADAELRELLTPALRADMTLVETYQYQPEDCFDCPIVAFGGESDPMVSADALSQWREQTRGQFSQRIVHGDHLFLQSARTILLSEIERSIFESAAVSSVVVPAV